MNMCAPPPIIDLPRPLLIRLCINVAQDELYLVYTCIQHSFQKNSKECNMAETTTSFWDMHSLSGQFVVCVYTKMKSGQYAQYWI